MQFMKQNKVIVLFFSVFLFFCSKSDEKPVSIVKNVFDTGSMSVVLPQKYHVSIDSSELHWEYYLYT